MALAVSNLFANKKAPPLDISSKEGLPLFFFPFPPVSVFPAGNSVIDQRFLGINHPVAADLLGCLELSFDALAPQAGNFFSVHLSVFY